MSRRLRTSGRRFGERSPNAASQPTAPQRLAIPPLSAGENTLVIAPTGSGKTETAMLPVFDHLVAGDGEPSTPRRSSSEAHADGGPPEGFGVLYITPLRALNRDMRERLEWWGDYLDLEVDVRHGDTTQYQRGNRPRTPRRTDHDARNRASDAHRQAAAGGARGRLSS